MPDASLDTVNSPTSVPARAPDTRGFLERIKDVVGEVNFEQVFGILDVERDCTAVLLTGDGRPTEEWRFQRLPRPAVLEHFVINSRSKHGILLIEEMDRGWLELLDVTFGLDPLFVFAYAKGKHITPGVLRSELEPCSHALLNSGLFPRGVKDKWCALRGTSSSSPNEREYSGGSNSRSYWRERFRQEPKGTLKSVAASCHLSPCVCKQGPCAGRIINAFADKRLDLIITENSPYSCLPRGSNLLISNALEFRTVYIPWALYRPMGRVWHGYWYLLGDDLSGILCNTSEGASSSNLAFNLLFGIGDATQLPKHAREQEVDVSLRFELLLLLIARRPLQRTISCLSDQLSEARYMAQTSPSSDTYLSLLAFRRTFADVGLSIARTKEFSSQFYGQRFEDMQQSPKPITAEFKQLKAQFDQMNKDLKEEIQLIIGAVTVQDADLARQQSDRATLLTLLAAMYLPLTLVTGIFGMNIRDIDDGRPPFWWCMVVLVVIIALTMIAYLGLKSWQRQQRSTHE